MNVGNLCGSTECPFSEWFNAMIDCYGAKYTWDICVLKEGMSAWEFRFWAGHKGLV